MDLARRDLTAKLSAHLAGMGAKRIWRPVIGPDGAVLAAGSGPAPQMLAEYMTGVDFHGKSVVDLGSNLGFYSFMAARSGAKSVLGLDSDPDAVRGGRMLAALYGFPGVDFKVCDFLKDPPARKADMALVIDFIGRGVVAKGRLDDVVASAAAHADREIVLTLRPIYPLHELPPLGPVLLNRYAAHIQDDRFRLADYVSERLGPAWKGRIIHLGRVGGYVLKAALLFSSAKGSRNT